MHNLTIGKIRGLQQISTREGLIIILALDHRGSLAKLLGTTESDPAFYTTIRDFKLMILEHLLDHASAALLDPQYIAADAIARGVVPGDKGLLIALEKSGYAGSSTARLTQVLQGWSLAKIKRMGGSAVKFYVDYNPESGELAEQQEQLVATAVAEARRLDVALVVEPVTYSLDERAPKGSAEFARRRPALVAETARRIGALGPDMLKLEFPHDANHVMDEGEWADACAALNEATPLPWAVLSAGVDFETFKRQAKIACQAGASGYVAGRSFWQDLAKLPRAEHSAFLRSVATARMAEAEEIARAYAHPWTARYPDLASAGGDGWYKEYPE